MANFDTIGYYFLFLCVCVFECVIALRHIRANGIHSLLLNQWGDKIVEKKIEIAEVKNNTQPSITTSVRKLSLLSQ